jgi:hypothetical protein
MRSSLDANPSFRNAIHTVGEPRPRPARSSAPSLHPRRDRGHRGDHGQRGISRGLIIGGWWQLERVLDEYVDHNGKRPHHGLQLNFRKAGRTERKPRERSAVARDWADCFASTHAGRTLLLPELRPTGWARSRMCFVGVRVSSSSSISSRSANRDKQCAA